MKINLVLASKGKKVNVKMNPKLYSKQVTLKHSKIVNL